MGGSPPLPSFSVPECKSITDPMIHRFGSVGSTIARGLKASRFVIPQIPSEEAISKHDESLLFHYHHLAPNVVYVFNCPLVEHVTFFISL